MPRPIIEPFRIKVVEPIRMTTTRERQQILEAARYNLFAIRAEDVVIDLLTDSGTGAMSAEQWAAIMRGDESYAGARSYYRFAEAANALTGMPFVFPTHQGRAAERILCAVTELRGKTVLSNGLFDTTRANIEARGARGIDLPRTDALSAHAPFGGDMDLEALDRAIASARGELAFVVMIEAIAQGLHEVLDESYLEYRFAASEYLARSLARAGWPAVEPAAAHAVYVDAGAALPHLLPRDLPGQSFACAMYLAGGVRTCELAELMFGGAGPRQQLVRFALPRRVYTQSHVDYVGAVAEEVAAVRQKLPAMRIVDGADRPLRHFTAALAPTAPFPNE